MKEIDRLTVELFQQCEKLSRTLQQLMALDGGSLGDESAEALGHGVADLVNAWEAMKDYGLAPDTNGHSTPPNPDAAYAGSVGIDGTITVTYDGRPLDPRPSQQLRNHSPAGFNWGYGGSGPAQLALAILLHATGDETIATAFYQSFMSNVVARWDNSRGSRWEMPARDVITWLELHGATEEGQERLARMKEVNGG